MREEKRLVREGIDMKLQPLPDLSAAYQSLAQHTADHDEAIAAFIEERPPHFSGR